MSRTAMIDHYAERWSYHETNVLADAESAAEVVCEALGFSASEAKSTDEHGELIRVVAEIYARATSLENPSPRLKALMRSLEPSLERVVRRRMDGIV